MADWGHLSGTQIGGRNSFNRFFYYGGTSPSGSNVLDSITIYVNAAQTIRLALYSGGSAGDPSGATLLEDLGTFSHGGTGFETKTAAGTTALPDASLIWIAAEDNGFSSARYDTVGGLPHEDLDYAVSLAGDQSNGAWPGSAPSTTYTTEAYGFLVYLTYSAASSGTTVTPGTGALTLTGYAPTVTAQGNVTVTPGVASITVTGYAPTVTAPETVTPGGGALSLTGYAPTVTAPETVTPGLASLTVTGYPPTVTAPETVTPGVGSLTLTGYAPTVTAPANVWATPGLGNLTLTGYAPTVGSGDKLLTPGVGVLTLTGHPPTLTGTTKTVTVGVAALTLTGYAPTVRSLKPVLNVYVGPQ